MEDHEILLKFQNLTRRNPAFNQLVRKYQRKGSWHVRKMTVDHNTAANLTQNVPVRPWKPWPRRCSGTNNRG